MSAAAMAREKDSQDILSMWRGDRDTRHECCGAPGIVIHPKTPFRQAWDAYIIVLIIYSCSFEPFKAAFAERDTLDSWFDIFVDSCYWLDIVLNFVTGFEVDGYQVILDRNMIARNYLTGWFAIDLTATFPWDAVIRLEEEQTSTDVSFNNEAGGVHRLALFRLLRLIRVLRVVRVGRIVERLSHIVRVRGAFFKILQLALSLLAAVHLFACFFFLIPGFSAKNNHELPPVIRSNFSAYAHALHLTNGGLAVERSSLRDLQPCDIDLESGVHGYMARSWVCDNTVGPGQGAGIGRKYLVSLYWGMTTISTIGYGDVSPNLGSSSELMFTTAIQFVGMFVFSYTVSAMAGLIGNLNAKDKEFQIRLDRYIEFMRDKNIPKDVQARALAYLNYVQASAFEVSDDESLLLNGLSPSLQAELQQSVYIPILRRIPVLTDQQEFLVVTSHLFPVLLDLHFSHGTAFAAGGAVHVCADTDGITGRSYCAERRTWCEGNVRGSERHSQSFWLHHGQSPSDQFY
jgi:hyperpolarization activated cyclic nucleotide-gated potassium channel 2